MDSHSRLAPDAVQALAEAAREWPAVQVLMVFGSAAQGSLQPASDLDLYVRLRQGAAREPDAEAHFVGRASDICRREVDLVVEDSSTSVILRREVAAKGRACFEREPGAARALVVDAVSAYVDLEPQLRKIGAAIRQRATREGAAALTRLRAGAADGR